MEHRQTEKMIYWCRRNSSPLLEHLSSLPIFFFGEGDIKLKFSLYYFVDYCLSFSPIWIVPFTWPSIFVLFQLAILLPDLQFLFFFNRPLYYLFFDFVFAFLAIALSVLLWFNGFGLPLWCLQTFFTNNSPFVNKGNNKLPNSEQSYKRKVKTHKYINRQNQSTRKEYLIKGEMINVQLFSRKKKPVFISRNSRVIYMYLFILFLWTFSKVFPNSGIFEIVNTCMLFQSTEILNWYTLFSRSKCFYHRFTQDMLNFAYVIDSKCNKSYLQGV